MDNTPTRNRENTHRDTIKIVTWNIASVHQHKTKLLTMSNNHRPDVILLQETKIKPKHTFRIPGYETITKHNEMLAHTITILIKHSVISVSKIKLVGETHPIQAYQVHKEGIEEDIIIVNIYKTHGVHNLDYVTLNYILERYNKVILGGDFNTQINSSANGEELAEFIAINNLVNPNINNEETNLSYYGSTIIDYLLVTENVDQNMVKFQTLTSIPSGRANYHIPLMITLEYESNDIPTPRMNWTKLNRNLYQKKLKQNMSLPDFKDPGPLNNREDISNEMDRITKCIMETVQEVNPPRIPKKRLGWQPSNELNKLSKDRNKYLKKYNKSKDALEKMFFKKIANNLANKINNLTKAERDKFYADSIKDIEKLPPSSTEFWKKTNGLAGIKRSSLNTKYLKYNNKTAKGNAEKAQCHLEYQETVFRENNVDTRETREYWAKVINPRAKWLEDEDVKNLDFVDITINDIIKALKTTKPQKAGGRDDMKAICISWGTTHLWRRLCKLYNACLQHKYQPEGWKEALIVLIPKPGKDHTDPAGYRPISLLAVIAKLFDKIICGRLRHSIEQATNANGKPFLPPEQSGFREKRTTTDNLFRLMQIATQAMQKHEDTLIISLDGKKAFDTAAHKAIMSPLVDLTQRNQIPFYIVSYYKQFLTSRSFRIRQGKEITLDKGSIEAGVPQGSISAPLLYIIFTADIPMPTNVPKMQSRIIQDVDVETAIKSNVFKLNHVMEVGMFADDIAAWTRLSNGTNMRNAALTRFQTFLDNTEKWANERKIVFNADKTQLMKTQGSKYQAKPNLSFYNKELKYTNELKYLGVTFDHKLTMVKHAKQIRIRTLQRINRLGYITRVGKINPHTAMHWMQTLAFPIAAYGAITWIANPWNVRNLHHIYNQARRKACRAPGGTTNTWLNEIIKPKDLEQWCYDMAKKWYIKTTNGPKGYANLSVMKSIANSANWESNPRTRKKFRVYNTPMQTLRGKCGIP